MAALDFPRRCISCMVRLIFQKLILVLFRCRQFSDQICTISVIGNARIKKVNYKYYALRFLNLFRSNSTFSSKELLMHIMNLKD